MFLSLKNRLAELTNVLGFSKNNYYIFFITFTYLKFPRATFYQFFHVLPATYSSSFRLAYFSCKPSRRYIPSYYSSCAGIKKLSPSNLIKVVSWIKNPVFDSINHQGNFYKHRYLSRSLLSIYIHTYTLALRMRSMSKDQVTRIPGVLSVVIGGCAHKDVHVVPCFDTSCASIAPICECCLTNNLLYTIIWTVINKCLELWIF